MSTQVAGSRWLDDGAGPRQIWSSMASRVLIAQPASPAGPSPGGAGDTDVWAARRHDDVELVALLAAMLGVLVLLAAALGGGPLS